MSGLGTKSDLKQKRMEALALAGSMKSENARRRQALVQLKRTQFWNNCTQFWNGL